MFLRGLLRLDSMGGCASASHAHVCLCTCSVWMHMCVTCVVAYMCVYMRGHAAVRVRIHIHIRVHACTLYIETESDRSWTVARQFVDSRVVRLDWSQGLHHDRRSSSWRTFQTCDNRFPDFDMRHPTSLVSMGVVLTCDVMRQDSRVPTWWSRFLWDFW